MVASGIPLLFSGFVLVDKDCGFIGAIKNSFNLVRGSRIKIILLLIVFTLIGTLIGYFINVIFTMDTLENYIFKSFVISPIFLFIMAFTYRKLEEQS